MRISDWSSDVCSSDLGSRLASREVDILTLVSGGLRNREIGDRLGLTEGTVKWYMQQIYDKLGVRRRPQAVIRARQMRSEEHTSELQSLMRIAYAVFCLNKKKCQRHTPTQKNNTTNKNTTPQSH